MLALLNLLKIITIYNFDKEREIPKKQVEKNSVSENSNIPQDRKDKESSNRPIQIDSPININLDIQGNADENVIGDLESRLTSLIKDQVISEFDNIGEKLKDSFDLV